MSSAPASSTDGLPPPLEMWRAAAHPDGWRQVTAPGGYEWWHFDAESDDGRTHLFIDFYDGYPFHPAYLRRYGRFVRRPTRRPPPAPADFPCVHFSVCRDGRLASHFTQMAEPGGLVAGESRPFVQIGPCSFELDEGRGAYALVLAAQQPEAAGGQLRARLEFTPGFEAAASEQAFPCRSLAGGEHRWLPAAPRCTVSGTVELGGGERIQFSGQGSHDHSFGTAPIALALRQWIRGRMLTQGCGICFHYACGRGGADEGLLTYSDAAGTRQVSDGRPAVTWESGPPLVLSCPRVIDFSEALRLVRPRVIASGSHYLRLVYEASARGVQGTALCEVIHPRRLRWPLVGRVVQANIHPPPTD